MVAVRDNYEGGAMNDFYCTLCKLEVSQWHRCFATGDTKPIKKKKPHMKDIKVQYGTIDGKKVVNSK